MTIDFIIKIRDSTATTMRACFGSAGYSPSVVDPSPTPARSFPLLLHAAFFFTGVACIDPRLGLSATIALSSSSCDLHQS